MKVGVVVPNKNGGRFLRDALESILTQDYPDVECVLVDGESTDDSLAIAQEYDGRIRWCSQADSCAAEAINRGWQMTEAPILAWLNSDDMWAPGAVTRVVEVFATHSEADVVSGECLIMNEDGETVGLWPTGPFDLLRSLGEAAHILSQPAVFIRRTALERVGWLREMWLHDHDLWLRLGLRSTFIHINDVLALARNREENVGLDADVAGPMRVKLIKDFLARDDLPPEAKALRRRAMSWAHLRASEAYLRPRRFGKTLLHLGLAWHWDASNPEVYRLLPRRGRGAIKKRVRQWIGFDDI